MRQARLRAIALGTAIAAALPATAWAQPRAGAAATSGPKPLSQTLTGEAKAAYDAGKLLAGDGDYAAAAIKFKAAYDLSSDARLLWNIAACEKAQRHYAHTMALVRQYLDTGKELLTEADRREAKALLDAIESFTVRMTIAVSEAGADVFVDDERVGTAPLVGPVTVDIGQRRITAKKAGFKDATQQLQVGGSTTASVELKLEQDVHQGHLTVRTQADGRISIDGAAVGKGTFEGPLKSGGHTLRVEADGMRAYQSEVTLADDEKRSIDVPLEKIYAPPPAIDLGPSFEIGANGGTGVKLHGDNPWMTVARLDVGLRLGWAANLGLFAEYAALDASGQCGTDTHPSSPSNPLDLGVRVSFRSCTYLKAGLQLVVHFLPAHAVDPWIAVEPAARLALYDYSTFDPLTGATARSSPGLPTFDVGGRLGVDWHPVRAFRPWAIGLFGSLVYTPIADESPAHNAGNTAAAPPGASSGSVPLEHYFSVVFGLRSSLAF